VVKRLILLAATLATLSSIAATPSLAQTATEAPGSGEAIAVPYGEAPPPDPPDYVFEEGGTVTVDGDVGMSCRAFALSIPRADASPDLEQARSVLEQCEQAGFLPSGSVPTVLPTQWGQYQTPSGSGGDIAAPAPPAALPNTGGPDLLLTATTLLLGSGVLAFGILRRR
jgi:hypothetical protein